MSKNVFAFLIPTPAPRPTSTSRKSGVVVQNVMFQIERLWVRSLAPAAAGGANGGGPSNKDEGKNSFSGRQSKPSTPSSSMASSPFPPPSVSSGNAPDVIGDADGSGTSFDSRAVLSPILLYDKTQSSSRSICTTCKQVFTPEDNAWDSCRCVALSSSADRPKGLGLRMDITQSILFLLTKPSHRPHACVQTNAPDFTVRSTVRMACSSSMVPQGALPTPPSLLQGENSVRLCVGFHRHESMR